MNKNEIPLKNENENEIENEKCGDLKSGEVATYEVEMPMMSSLMALDFVADAPQTPCFNVANADKRQSILRLTSTHMAMPSFFMAPGAAEGTQCNLVVNDKKLSKETVSDYQGSDGRVVYLTKSIVGTVKHTFGVNCDSVPMGISEVGVFDKLLKFGESQKFGLKVKSANAPNTGEIHVLFNALTEFNKIRPEISPIRVIEFDIEIPFAKEEEDEDAVEELTATKPVAEQNRKLLASEPMMKSEDKELESEMATEMEKDEGIMDFMKFEAGNALSHLMDAFGALGSDQRDERNLQIEEIPRFKVIVRYTAMTDGVIAKAADFSLSVIPLVDESRMSLLSEAIILDESVEVKCDDVKRECEVLLEPENDYDFHVVNNAMDIIQFELASVEEYVFSDAVVVADEVSERQHVPENSEENIEADQVTQDMLRAFSQTFAKDHGAAQQLEEPVEQQTEKKSGVADVGIETDELRLGAPSVSSSDSGVNLGEMAVVMGTILLVVGLVMAMAKYAHSKIKKHRGFLMRNVQHTDDSESVVDEYWSMTEQTARMSVNECENINI